MPLTSLVNNTIANNFIDVVYHLSKDVTRERRKRVVRALWMGDTDLPVESLIRPLRPRATTWLGVLYSDSHHAGTFDHAPTGSKSWSRV